MQTLNRNLIVKSTSDVMEVAGAIANVVDELNVEKIIGITCFDEYSSLYTCPNTSNSEIILIFLNDWLRSGSGFMKQSLKALEQAEDSERSLIFVDDLKVFFSQGTIYAPETLEDCLELLSLAIKAGDIVVVNSLHKNSIDSFFSSI